MKHESPIGFIASLTYIDCFDILDSIIGNCFALTRWEKHQVGLAGAHKFLFSRSMHMVAFDVLEEDLHHDLETNPAYIR